MTSRITLALKQTPTLAVYFVLAYLISWLIWSPLAFNLVELGSHPLAPYLHAFGFMGPMLAALIVVSTTQGLPGFKQLLSGLGRCRIGHVPQPRSLSAHQPQ